MSFVFHLIPHTHWDREWYLPRGAFLARLVPLIDDLLERLRADGDFRSFLLDGQTILLEDYLRVRPERAADLRTAVATGRVQAGPWYVLVDEQIPGGEALIRNLLLGTSDAERMGHRLDALYSPDAFGHPAAWPALAREFGIGHGTLWRGVPAGVRDRFRWRAPDGRHVFVWHLPPAGYEVGAGLIAEPERLPAAWASVRAALVARAGGPHLAVFIGADHHAAPAGVGPLRAAIAALEPEHTVRISRLDEFLGAAAAAAGDVPEVVGELRAAGGVSWVLQGTHGTRAPLKRQNAVLELWLERVAEPLAALAQRAGGLDRRPLLEAAWRTLVASQFHDTLCGTVSDAVARAVAVRHDHIAALAREITRDSLLELAHHDAQAPADGPHAATPALVLWNPAARPRTGVVVADVTWFRRDVAVGPPGPPGRRAIRRGEGAPAFALRGPDGGVPVQVLDRRVTLERRDAARHGPDLAEVEVVRIAFAAPPVPALGLATLTAGPPLRAPARDGVTVVARSLVNRYVAVALEPAGGLTMVHRATGTRWSGLLHLESGGDVGDAYTVQAPARDRIVRSRGPIRVRRLAAGPLAASLEARWRFPCGRGDGARRRGHVDVRLVVTLLVDSPVAHCVLEVDNQARYHRLRARLPLGLAGAPALAGSAFAVSERPPVGVAAARAGGAEAAVATAPAHRWVAVAPADATSRGLAVLAPGFFEYEWTPDGTLLVTLLRAVGDLSRADLPARPGHAAWPTAIPGAQCLGPDRVELGLVPVSAAALTRGDAVPRFWEDTFLPLRAAWLRETRGLAPAPVSAALDGTGLVLSAVKPAQAGPGTALRCYNATARPGAGAWRFGAPVRAAYRVRADERESQPLVLEDRGRTVRFSAGPWEIVTIVVE